MDGWMDGKEPQRINERTLLITNFRMVYGLTYIVYRYIYIYRGGRIRRGAKASPAGGRENVKGRFCWI